ncbi:limonene-1,2-epoxide hydrolase family protein [Streptomyces arenae]|uniref:limonene-1,2-epoxide hydrolase family protein n=1 Tax=Streptomyces arenae TaxID=29301 RepID=UPI00265AEAD0|nr:limonene-1,2-epoxide hydrolase family protein [Streptomyces arenae]MCG7207413.1 nuclear transport factor 2 family protein [Streptomyces arenae]
MLKRNGITAESKEEHVVLEFLDGMGPDLGSFVAAFEARLAEDAVWETVGLPPRTGRTACVNYLHTLKATTGMEYCAITLHALASRGTVVFTERDDNMYRADGSLIKAFRVGSVIVVEDGLITRYTDYCDLSSLRG